MPVSCRWDGGSHLGRSRHRNEDAWGAATLAGDGRGLLLAIADGMGGHPGGDVASRAAIESALDSAGLCPAGDPAIACLEGLYQRAQDSLRDRAKARPSLREMGTTLTVALLREDGCWVGHLGDSRLAWWRDGEICLVTRDHSVAWGLVEAGVLDAEAAERDPTGAMLTRFLGPTESPCNPDLLERPLLLERGDRLLLATDGLGKVVSMERAAAILRAEEVSRSVRLLIEATLDAGAPDNVTVVVAEALDVPASGRTPLRFEDSRYRWRESPDASH